MTTSISARTSLNHRVATSRLHAPTRVVHRAIPRKSSPCPPSSVLIGTGVVWWTHRFARERFSPETKRVVRCQGGSSSKDENQSAGDKDKSLSDLQEMQVAGFSISPNGFLVLLAPVGATVPRGPLNRVEQLRGVKTDVDSRATDCVALAVLVTDGTDTETAQSVEALTLLQLAQDPPIDMGTCLPYDALSNITQMPEAILGAVILATAGSEPSSAFKATLLAGDTNTSGSWDMYPQAAHSIPQTAWNTLALNLRYAPYGCKLFTVKELLKIRGFPLVDLVDTYPMMISRETAMKQGASVSHNLNQALRDEA